MLAFVVNRNVGRGFFGRWLKSLCKEQLNSGCNPYCKLFETQTSYLMCVPINLYNIVFFQLLINSTLQANYMCVTRTFY